MISRDFYDELEKITQVVGSPVPPPIPPPPGAPVPDKPAAVAPTPKELEPEEIAKQNKKQTVQAKKRFGRLATMLHEKGVDTGANLRRIAVPKRLLSKEDIEKHLGFKSVFIAVPEVGQKAFRSYRHPITHHHIHDHGTHWMIHEDKHASTTMLWLKSKLQKAGKLKEYQRPLYMKAKKGAKGVRKGGKKAMGWTEATVKGMPHLLTEGVPGMYGWTKATVTGLPGMKERVLAKLDPGIKKKFRRWKTSRTHKEPVPETPTAIAGSVVKPSPTPPPVPVPAIPPVAAGGVA
jgi:hypothetical protein